MSLQGPGATHHGAGSPSPWVLRFALLVAMGARVLDLACGHGRHSVFFAGRGCRVVAVDRDKDALAGLAGVDGITTLVADLEGGGWCFGEERFDVVVVTNYLHRELLPRLVRAVDPEGLLLYETFTAGNEVYGKPSNPHFLLREGELLSVVGDALTIVAFEQGAIAGEPPAVLQRIAAVGRARQWPPPLPA